MHVYLLGFGLKQIFFKILGPAIVIELSVPAVECEIGIFISGDLWLPVLWHILYTPCNHC